VLSSTPWPHFTPAKHPVPILQEAGWAPGPVWTGGKSLTHRDSIPDRPARSQSLYRLSYTAHTWLDRDRLLYRLSYTAHTWLDRDRLLYRLSYTAHTWLDRDRLFIPVGSPPPVQFTWDLRKTTETKRDLDSILFFPFSIIPPMTFIHLFIHYIRQITLVTAIVVK